MHVSLSNLPVGRARRLVCALSAALFITLLAPAGFAQSAVPGLQPYNQNDPQNYGSPASQSYSAPPASPQVQTVPYADPAPADPRTDPRNDPRTDPRYDPRNDPRTDPRYDTRNDPRYDPRNDPRYDPRNDPRNFPPGAADPYGQGQNGYDDRGGAQPQEIQQAPPPLLDVPQPESPGDGYTWTPGYWAYGPNGYFWVDGAWVAPPYTGALWTPGYWGVGLGDSDYFWNSGYWGNTVGFYGGIDYGFGYFGNGFYGGAWNGGRFYNNSAYVRLSPHNHSLYNYRYPGLGGVHPGGRSSFARFDHNRSATGYLAGSANPYGGVYPQYGGGYNSGYYAGNGYAGQGYTGAGLGHLAHPGDHTVSNGGAYGGGQYGGGQYGGGQFGGFYGGGQPAVSYRSAPAYQGAYQGGGPQGGGSHGGGGGYNGGSHGGGGGGGAHANSGGGGGGGGSHGGGGHR